MSFIFYCYDFPEKNKNTKENTYGVTLHVGTCLSRRYCGPRFNFFWFDNNPAFTRFLMQYETSTDLASRSPSRIGAVKDPAETRRRMGGADWANGGAVTFGYI
jgi:hypothetical protein